MSRLDMLLDLRRQIDVEIEIERASTQRLATIRRQATLASATSADSWDRRIVTMVAAHARVAPEDLYGRSRAAMATDARAAAMWALRKRGRTLTGIAAMFDGRDHTTVLHSVRRAEAEPMIQQLARRALDALEGETDGAA